VAYQYLFRGYTDSAARLKHCSHKEIAYRSSPSSRSLRMSWCVWKSEVLNSHYIITVDKVGATLAVGRLLAHPGMRSEEKWALRMTDGAFTSTRSRSPTRPTPRTRVAVLPLDTVHFSDLELISWRFPTRRRIRPG
jgi:hypothetical protein